MTLSRLYLRTAVLFMTIHQCQTQEQSSPAACFLGPARTDRKSGHPAGREESTPFFTGQHYSWAGPDIGAGVSPGFRVGQDVPVRSSLNTSGTPLHPSHPLSCLLLSCLEITQTDPCCLFPAQTPPPSVKSKHRSTRQETHKTEPSSASANIYL